jgi:hypothetical protein
MKHSCSVSVARKVEQGVPSLRQTLKRVVRPNGHVEMKRGRCGEIGKRGLRRRHLRRSEFVKRPEQRGIFNNLQSFRRTSTLDHIPAVIGDGAKLRNRRFQADGLMFAAGTGPSPWNRPGKSLSSFPKIQMVELSAGNSTASSASERPRDLKQPFRLLPCQPESRTHFPLATTSSLRPGTWNPRIYSVKAPTPSFLPGDCQFPVPGTLIWISMCQSQRSDFHHPAKHATTTAHLCSAG